MNTPSYYKVNNNIKTKVRKLKIETFNRNIMQFLISTGLSFLLGLEATILISIAENTIQVIVALFTYFVAIMSPYLVCNEKF